MPLLKCVQLPLYEGNNVGPEASKVFLYDIVSLFGRIHHQRFYSTLMYYNVNRRPPLRLQPKSHWDSS